jgi:uncharacterized membrane protein YraQ (UPF0718 family)
MSLHEFLFGPKIQISKDWQTIIIGIITGLISGLISGWVVTKYYTEKDNKNQAYRLLFKVCKQYKDIYWILKNEKPHKFREMILPIINEVDLMLLDINGRKLNSEISEYHSKILVLQLEIEKNLLFKEPENLLTDSTLDMIIGTASDLEVLLWKAMKMIDE